MLKLIKSCTSGPINHLWDNIELMATHRVGKYSTTLDMQFLVVHVKIFTTAYFHRNTWCLRFYPPSEDKISQYSRWTSSRSCWPNKIPPNTWSTTKRSNYDNHVMEGEGGKTHPVQGAPLVNITNFDEHLEVATSNDECDPEGCVHVEATLKIYLISLIQIIHFMTKFSPRPTKKRRICHGSVVFTFF